MTINVPWAAVSEPAGAPIVNGDPGTGASEPSPLILNPVISGVSASLKNKNSAGVLTCGTAAAIGVGVGVGVGVGEIVGVGVGEGPPTTTLRGEITHPAMSRSNMNMAAMAANCFGREQRYRTLLSDAWEQEAVAAQDCAVFTPM